MNPNIKWTFENCRLESLKYKTKSKFKLNSGGAYNAALKNNWLKLICSHMISPQKPKNYWTFENCLKEAKKYKYRNEFHKKSSSAYNVANKNNWLNKICEHMELLGNRFNKLVYVYEFPDNSVYVGLTYNEKQRIERHTTKSKSPVYKHINDFNLKPVYKRITDYINVKEAQFIEGETINKYKKNGWNILNKSKPGGIGGKIKIWTKEMCKEKIQFCKTKTDFQNKFNAAYKSAYRNGWLKELFIDMPEVIKPNGYWTKEKCQQESKKYISRTQFQKNSSGAYDKARKNKWLNDICLHMKN